MSISSQKKLLLLGAVTSTIPLIKKARERGIHIITCDYLPQNEGHQYADESYYYSTTDIDAILELSRRIQIDGILSFNSDVSALTAAMVAEQMGLSGNKPEVINTMTQKHLFRLFLKEHHFNVPEFGCYISIEEWKVDEDKFSFPLIVKPVDLSGSKGVKMVNNKVELECAFANAYQLSRAHKVIIEEYIKPKGCQLHGDGFAQNGKLLFACLGDHHYGLKMQNFVPYSTTFPSEHTQNEIEAVLNDVRRFLSEIGFNSGGLNIEARITEDGKVYIMEIGPRNGGNFTPRIIEYATGFDFDNAAVNASLGLETKYDIHPINGYYAYYVLHSDKAGCFESIEYDKFLNEHTFEEWLYVKKGENVETFNGGNKALGTLLEHIDSRDELEDLLTDSHYVVKKM